jgi:hypothetical protein
MADVGLSISGIPGPLGSTIPNDDYIPGFTSQHGTPFYYMFVFINNCISFKYSPSLPLILATQPSSQGFHKEFEYFLLLLMLFVNYLLTVI